MYGLIAMEERRHFTRSSLALKATFLVQMDGGIVLSQKQAGMGLV
jgi:hypothetical protein